MGRCGTTAALVAHLVGKVGIPSTDKPKVDYGTRVIR
jgi:hypothetical protein